jgi:SPP1 gp7 family putative phage head morphogenesis protein
MLTEQRLDAEAEQRRLRRLEAQLIQRIQIIDGDLTVKLRDAYVAASQDLNRILQDTFIRYGATNWSITDVGQYQRQQFLLDQLSSRIDQLTARLSLDMRDSLADTYRDAYSGRQWLLSQSLPTGTALNLPILPEQAALAAIAFPYQDANFFERLGDNAAEFTRKMRRSIVASQVMGESMWQAQKRLVQELGWPIGRRTKAEAIAHNGHYARTELIARTEMMRASNLGAAAVDEANRDILEGWEWMATRDSRTDSQCAALDGRVFGLDSDRSRPPLHPRCRCTSIPVRRSNRALGLPEVPSEFPRRESYSQWKQRMGR